MTDKIELLSPAGDFESFCSAINFGADAVYLAGKFFGMRTSSKNFSDEDMKAAVKLAHENKKRVFVTLNTIPKDDEIKKLPEYLQFLDSIKVDAVIVADIGILRMIKKYAPDLEVHISTQAGIVNSETANAFYEMGAKRVVLARELSFKDIIEIRRNIPSDLEIETFVHGAMCISFSGRCLISSYMTGRDANRGDCAQPCRWKYHLFEENREGQFFPVEEHDGGTYLYNSRDMCMIDYIPELVKSGINSIKIEGRAKSSYYTAVVTNAYRHALDDYYKDPENYILKPWIREELDKISHREYSTGFYLGTEPGQVVSNGGYIRHYNVVAISEGTSGDTVKIIQRNKFSVGDKLDVLPKSGIPFEFEVTGLINERGEAVTSAPHAMEVLYMPSNGVNIEPGSIFRKQISEK